MGARRSKYYAKKARPALALSVEPFCFLPSVYESFLPMHHCNSFKNRHTGRVKKVFKFSGIGPPMLLTAPVTLSICRRLKNRPGGPEGSSAALWRWRLQQPWERRTSFDATVPNIGAIQGASIESRRVKRCASVSRLLSFWTAQGYQDFAKALIK